MQTPRILSALLAISFLAACGDERLSALKTKAPSVSIDPVEKAAPGVVISFHGQATPDVGRDLVSWQWDFGDGSTAEGESATHAYAAEGQFRVTFTVTDDADKAGHASATVTIEQPIVPVNEAPTARIQGPMQVTAGQTFTLDGTKSHDTDGRIVDFAWSFDDGATDTGPSIMHSFSQAGMATVTLTVTDDGGATATSDPFPIEVIEAMPSHSTWSYGRTSGTTGGCSGFVPGPLTIDISGTQITITEQGGLGGSTVYGGTYTAASRHFAASHSTSLGGSETLDATFSADYRTFTGKYSLMSIACNGDIQITGTRKTP